MASGDTLFIFTVGHNDPPSTNYATEDVIAATEGIRRVLDFVGSGGSADEVAIFEGVWPSWYDGGGVTIKLHVSTDGTSTGEVQWEVSVETTGDGEGAAGAGFGTPTDITVTPSGTANVEEIVSGNVSHVNCGSPATGETARFNIARDHDHATNTDDGQLHSVEVLET